MATSAFKSTTKRSSIGATVDSPLASSLKSCNDYGSSNRSGMHRRSKSLSRFPGRFSDFSRVDGEEKGNLSGRFVNTVQGSSEFPEISLDVLADKFCPVKMEVEERESVRGRLAQRCPGVIPLESRAAAVVQSRGRSVSRHQAPAEKCVVDNGRRRQRSVSVARYQCSYSETDHPTSDGVGSGLFEEMRREVRNVVAGIRTELEQVLVKSKPAVLGNGGYLELTSTDAIEAIAQIRNNYNAKLEQSEKRTRELLSELAIEEQRGQEFSKILRELLPEPKQSAEPTKPSRARKETASTSRSAFNNDYPRSSHGSSNRNNNFDSIIFDSNESSAGFPVDRTASKLGKAETYLKQCVTSKAREKIFRPFEMDEYLQLLHTEDLLLERMKHRQRINFGGLLLCSRNFF